MSKSLKRVMAALEDAGAHCDIVKTGQGRTALDAAQQIGCAVDQIAKSIIFRGEETGLAVLFLTAGGRRVDLERACLLAGETLGKADAALVRTQTGFAIGGVAPIGHLNPIKCFMDEELNRFETIWAAAGTPHHVFSSSPARLAQLAQAVVATFSN